MSSVNDAFQAYILTKDINCSHYYKTSDVGGLDIKKSRSLPQKLTFLNKSIFEIL